MTIKVDPSICPKCGTKIPNDAPQGLCPKCALLGAAATESGVAPATADIPSLARVAAAFPHLEILELLGRGGMGFVFKVRQPHLDRFVALKLLPEKLARDPHFAERFSREARVLARLNHPGIVSIYDFGQAGGFYFLLMEYVDGVNLHQAMQAGRFSPAAALGVVPKICEALQFAHEHGVLHRDIKPANILLDTKGRVKIADFGIAKLVGDPQADLHLTATGAAIGTPHYMAPEQLEKPGTVDHRADIYSLGVVFYELLTGELPVGRFAPPSKRTPLDPRVDEVVMRTLEREREKRFQSAGEVKTQVEHLTQISPTPGAVGPQASTLDPAQDFILCPPRLPRMAKAILIYALLVAPCLWFLSLFTFEPPPANPLVAFTQGLVDLAVTAGEFVVLVFLAVGGWKLRALRVSSVRWLMTSLWLHLGLIILAIAGQIWVGVLEMELMPDAPTTPPGVSDGLLLAISLVSLAFEIGALVWLHRHADVLKSICMSGVGPHGTRVISSGTKSRAWKVVLKWAAMIVLFGAVGLVALGTFLNLAQEYFTAINATASTEQQSEPSTGAEAGSPGISFTFTAVELREVDNQRWLAIDYLDEVHGDCQKSFPWESKIPGFKPEVRTSEFVKDPRAASGVRHQRVEYLLPASTPQRAIEDLRRNVDQALKYQTIRLKSGDQKLLFEFGSSSDTALKAWIKVTPHQTEP